LPTALIAAARLTGHRSAPLAVLAIALVVGMIGGWIAQVGFDIIPAVSFIEEEIAKDPTSPIAWPTRSPRKTAHARGRAEQQSIAPVRVRADADHGGARPAPPSGGGHARLCGEPVRGLRIHDRAHARCFARWSPVWDRPPSRCCSRGNRRRWRLRGRLARRPPRAGRDLARRAS